MYNNTKEQKKTKAFIKVFFVAMDTDIENEKPNCVTCQISIFTDSPESVKSIPLPVIGSDTLNVHYLGLLPNVRYVFAIINQLYTSTYNICT